MYGYIYIITNNIDGKRYVGQTVQTIKKRFSRHCWESTKNTMPVDIAIKKYGKESFSIEMVSKCNSQEELNSEELKIAAQLNTFVPYGYNLKAGNGKGSLCEEIKNKISSSNLGKKCTEESKRKMSESHRNKYPSPITRAKLSEACRGEKNPFYGKKHKSDTLLNLRRWCDDNKRNDKPFSERTLSRAPRLMGFERNIEGLFVMTEQAIRIQRMYDSNEVTFKDIYTTENLSRSGLAKMIKNIRRMKLTQELRNNGKLF